MQVPDGFGGARVRSPGPELTINIENVAGISIMLAAHVPSNTNNSPAVHQRFTGGSRPCQGGVALGCYGMYKYTFTNKSQPFNLWGSKGQEYSRFCSRTLVGRPNYYVPKTSQLFVLKSRWRWDALVAPRARWRIAARAR